MSMPSPNTDELQTRIHELETLIAHRTDQLLASTARSYSFLDSINKGFIMCDISGEVVLANNALLSILAEKSSKIGAGTALTIEAIDRLMQPDIQLQTLVKQCIDAKQTIERDDINFGTKILRAYITPLTSGDNREQSEILGVIILIEDLTEQKMLDRSKDEFLSIASHELRTPLTAIRGNTSLILKYYSKSLSDPEVSDMLNDIHESSIQLIGIVNDFLDVAALEQGKIEIKPENFALQEVSEDVARELSNLCDEKGIQLSLDESLATVPMVTADKQRIQQVIINLVGNAIKFTDEGRVTLSATNANGLVQMTVTDTGKGISPEIQKLLFRKFQQAGSSLLTRETSKGTGLGLYISKLIIELSGGSIWLEKSEIGTGSTFAFTLPQA